MFPEWYIKRGSVNAKKLLELISERPMFSFELYKNIKNPQDAYRKLVIDGCPIQRTSLTGTVHKRVRLGRRGGATIYYLRTLEMRAKAIEMIEKFKYMNKWTKNSISVAVLDGQYKINKRVKRIAYNREKQRRYREENADEKMRSV